MKKPDDLEEYFTGIAHLLERLQSKNITKVSYLYFLEGLEFNRRMVLY